jgi:hypothetical protein
MAGKVTEAMMNTPDEQTAALLCELAAARLRMQHATITRLVRILDKRGCADALANAGIIAQCALEKTHA